MIGDDDDAETNEKKVMQIWGWWRRFGGDWRQLEAVEGQEACLVDLKNSWIVDRGS